MQIARILPVLFVLACGESLPPDVATTTTMQSDEAAIRSAAAMPHRSDANKKRDVYRHPIETLAFFGVKPDMIIKGGSIAAAQMGDPNASIPTPQPVHYRPMFGAFGKARTASSLVFVSKAAVKNGLRRKLGIDKELVAVEHTRDISKKSMVHNGATPKITVDPETYEVTADGELLTCAPAETLPMAQRYFLF